MVYSKLTFKNVKESRSNFKIENFQILKFCDQEKFSLILNLFTVLF